MKALIGSLGLIAAVCMVSACGARTPPDARSGAPLSARIVLPARTMKAGSTIKASIVVDNRTGHAIRTTGCGSLFGISLESRSYHPAVAWRSCLQKLTIRPGQTRYKALLIATYSQCSNDGASTASPACLPHYKMPPLPPGQYHVVLDQSRHLMPAPQPIPVLLTPAR